MSDNTALVLIVCTISVTIGAGTIALIRGAVEAVRIVKGKEPPSGGLMR